jgi:hypothetical protein
MGYFYIVLYDDYNMLMLLLIPFLICPFHVHVGLRTYAFFRCHNLLARSAFLFQV